MYLLCLVLATIVLLFNYASRVVCALAFFTLTALFWALQTSHGLLFYVPAGIVLCVLLFCYAGAWRRRLLMRGVYQHWRDSVPDLSDTEREVLDAGVTGWEQEFFNGRPNWQKLETCPWGQLTAEEEAFLTGPVEALCALYDPWTMGALKRDIPNTVWSFIRDHGFLGMIIPKEWGGLGFSALAHSAVIAKIGSYDPSLATAIGVPNSLGPAELLLHYGTEAQKKSLLPRLAKGQEIPCFALTSPVAGSDAGSIIDQGVVCQGDYQGRSVLGVRLNWDKRYITLSPVATLLGLAFKLYDPDHLLGEEENLGITLALVPTNLPGIHIGRHHFPLHTAFPNGPTQGEDVFIPMDQIIGGQDCIGMGWKMLMECLAAGRCISLPGVATGAASLMTPVSVSYACLREQFGRSIAAFEGVQASLVEAIADTYVCEAMRQFSASAVDAGQQSAVASAICKYHATEMGRSIVNHLMDVHGGKGICLGPSNYLGRMYDCVPICITVEGANILTRNLIIFGQGLMRLHPFARAEIETAHRPDINAGLKAFDRLAMQHIGRFLGHTVRSVVLGFTSGYACWRPSRKDKVIDYAYRHMTRFTAVFGFLTDVAMFSLQSKLKRMENVSARFADVLSDLYILSVVLKQYEKAGRASVRACGDAPGGICTFVSYSTTIIGFVE